MEIPDRIERLSARPGIEWTAAEARSIKEWLAQRPQLRRVWYFATRYLGAGVSEQDIEDAVVDFYALIDTARKSYKPGGPDFCYYLFHICFRNNCVREGDKLRKRSGREKSLDYEQRERILALRIADPRIDCDLGRKAESVAFTRDLSDFLNTRRLPEKEKTVFMLRYLEGMSYEGIAETVGAPIGSIKGWLNRATVSARQYLGERGWSECLGQK